MSPVDLYTYCHLLTSRATDNHTVVSLRTFPQQHSGFQDRTEHIDRATKSTRPYFTTMNDPGLNQLLQWSIENSVTSKDGSNSTSLEQPRDPHRGLDPQVLAQLMGGPSDADRMREAMTAIVAPMEQVNLENKLIAWDNFEQLIENLDNANNMQPLGLWVPLVKQLDHEDGEMRRMAAWCCSTAVQNNESSQERLLAISAIPKLLKLVLEDPVQAVRKKAASALSSEVRNYQAATDELIKHMPDNLWPVGKKVDAREMDQVDELVDILRSKVNKT